MVDADNQYRDLSEKLMKKEKELKDMANKNVIKYRELDTEFKELKRAFQAKQIAQNLNESKIEALEKKVPEFLKEIEVKKTDNDKLRKENEQLKSNIILIQQKEIELDEFQKVF